VSVSASFGSMEWSVVSFYVQLKLLSSMPGNTCSQQENHGKNSRVRSKKIDCFSFFFFSSSTKRREVSPFERVAAARCCENQPPHGSGFRSSLGRFLSHELVSSLRAMSRENGMRSLVAVEALARRSSDHVRKIDIARPPRL